jgi:ArsR family transcriptional regulator, arsenate/arsenite/antimonite-responsive transcriptional repressor / arsenate reductase (thioredoxin)
MRSGALDRSPPAFLQLVADPQRWQLLRELARSDRRVGELTQLLDRPQNLVSYHLAELRDAGLVIARRSSADRRDIYYRVDLLRCRDLLGATGAALHPGVRLIPAVPVRTVRRARTPMVLFLCTGNSARSQIAQALLEHRSDHTIAARSAGSHPSALHPNAVRVMAERGIDISGRQTKHLRRFTRTRFDRVITLCDKVREICPEFPGPPAAAHWSMPDPAAEADGDLGSYPAFCRTADELEERIALLIEELTVQSNERNHDER